MKKLLVLFVAMAMVVCVGNVFADKIDVEDSEGIISKNNKGTIVNGDYTKKSGIFGNTTTIQDNLNDNQVGLVNQKGADNQQGLINTKGHHNQTGLVNQAGHHNIQVVGSPGGDDYREGGDAQAQVQGQKQGQLQLQGQSQGQGQSMSFYQNFEDNIDYGHIATEIGKTDADLMEFDGASLIRTMSSIFKYDDDNFITMSEAKKASKGADIDKQEALLWTPKLDGQEITLDKLNYVETSGKYMGSMTFTTEDATKDQVIAQACEDAMKAGATSAKFTIVDAKKVSGTKYGFDLGSSGSVALNPDTGSAVISPGATLGWSKAKSDNRFVGEVYIELFFDANLIVAE